MNRKDPRTYGGGAEPASVSGGAEPLDINADRVDGNPGGGGGGYGYGYGGAGYGTNSSLDHVREYPANGLVPTGDGSLTYPSDVVVEQAANLGPISAFNANTAIGKRDKAQKMYDEADRAAVYLMNNILVLNFSQNN